MWFGVLGPLEVRDSQGEVVDVGPPQRRKVLAVLLAEAGLVVSTDRFVQAVWGEDADPSHLPTLQAHISRLRKTLGSELIVTQRPGYRLDVSAVDTDVAVAETLSGGARGLMETDNWNEAAQEFQKALKLWRGVPYEEFVGERFFEWEIDRLRELRISISEDLAETRLRRGEDSAIVSLLESLVRDNPLRERLRALLMVALYRSGRQADALSVFRDLRDQLADELGLEPSKEIQDLEMRILNHDPGLASQDNRDSAAITTTVRRRPMSTVRGFLVFESQRFHLDKSVVTIGRMPDRDVVIDDNEVSRRHAEVRRLTDEYLLVDVGSTNGTFVNGEAVTEYRLETGDVITVGDTDLIYSSQ